MLTLITQNPFRLLGVAVNASPKEVRANKSKMRAFLQAKKAVAFPTDLPTLLSPLARTIDEVNAAEGHLSLETNRIDAALFWLLMVDESDRRALAALDRGDIPAARQTLEGTQSAAGGQNRVVVELIAGDIPAACAAADALYARYAHDLSVAIGLNHDLTAGEFTARFVAALLRAEPTLKVQQLVDPKRLSAAWCRAASEALAAPIREELSSILTRCTATKGSDAKARLRAGKKLVADARKALKALAGVLPKGDPIYNSMSDKVANEALNCAIDFYNNGSEEREERAALTLAEAAARFAQGTMARQRMDENLTTMRERVGSLPPKGTEEDTQVVLQALAAFVKTNADICHSRTLLDTAEPALTRMKATLGATHPHYLKGSSQVVKNALVNIIDTVNATQKAYNDAPVGSSSEAAALTAYTKALSEALALTLRMEKYGMDDETRKHFNKQYKTLKELCVQINATNSNITTTDNSSGSSYNWLYYGLVAIALFLIRQCAS